MWVHPRVGTDLIRADIFAKTERFLILLFLP